MLGGSRPPARGDGRLHVLRGGVDVAVERELHGDLRAALRVRSSSSLDAGDGGELRARAAWPRWTPWSRDWRRAAPRSPGWWGNPRWAAPPPAARGTPRAEQHDGEAHQHRHDRALDEELREVHSGPDPILAASTSPHLGARKQAHLAVRHHRFAGRHAFFDHGLAAERPARRSPGGSPPCYPASPRRRTGPAGRPARLRREPPWRSGWYRASAPR